jgi:hypothetical protein
MVYSRFFSIDQFLSSLYADAFILFHSYYASFSFLLLVLFYPRIFCASVVIVFLHFGNVDQEEVFFPKLGSSTEGGGL